jgi:hypothetical protein
MVHRPRIDTQVIQLSSRRVKLMPEVKDPAKPVRITATYMPHDCIVVGANSIPFTRTITEMRVLARYACVATPVHQPPTLIMAVNQLVTARRLWNPMKIRKAGYRAKTVVAHLGEASIAAQ